MSGFMAGAGLLTVFVATVAEQGREHQAEAVAKAAMGIRRFRQAFCSGMEP